MRSAIFVTLLGLSALLAAAGEPQTQTAPTTDGVRPAGSVRAMVQSRPGGPMEEVEMAVHAGPTDLPSVGAADALLEPDELVLGVILEGTPVAYPLRYLAMFEVINDRSTSVPLSPTW